jgi:hypothetical protein
LAQRRFRRFGHGQQGAIIGGFRGDLLGHDQRMLAVDCRLHVVSRHFGHSGGSHELRFRFPVLLQFLQRFGDLARLFQHHVAEHPRLQLLIVSSHPCFLSQLHCGIAVVL